MALIEDQQAKAIAPAFQMDVRRIVGGHRQRVNVIMPTPDETDGVAEIVHQFRIPLIEKIDCRCHDDGRPTRFLNGENRHKSFPRPRRQDDHAARTLFPPGFDRFGLMGIRITFAFQLPFRWLIRTRIILIGDGLGSQRFNDATVEPPFRPCRVGAGIEGNTRQVGALIVGATRQDERTTFKTEMNGSRSHPDFRR